VKTALSFAFIFITVLLFWAGMVQTKSESEKITQNVHQTSSSLNFGNENNRSSPSYRKGIATKRKGEPDKRLPSSPLLRQEMSTTKLLYRAKQPSGNKGITSREALDMHRRVLNGKLFLKHLTQMIESSPNSTKLILEPFSNPSITLGNDALIRSLFSITQKDSNGSETMEVSSHGKTPEAARLLSQLIYRAHDQILDKESAQTPLLPIVAELAYSLQRKEEDIEELRRQIQQRQSAKPIVTVEEISLRAERDQCEKELAEHVEVLSTLKEAREKGASSENLASLSILSNKGNLADFSDTIKQLREFRNSPKAKNKAIREELDHQIAQAMQKLEAELTTVITSLKKAYSETLNRRNEVRARLVTIAKATSSESKTNPRFQLLEKREREIMNLRERYRLTLSRWQEAKLLLALANGQ
jgi:hypothetical protein